MIVSSVALFGTIFIARAKTDHVTDNIVYKMSQKHRELSWS